LLPCTRKFLLELHPALAGPVIDLAGAQDILNGFDGLLVELRPRSEFVANGLEATFDCEFVGHGFVFCLSVKRGTAH